jgi:hypothetical protein
MAHFANGEGPNAIEALLLRANARAQRRFHAMVVQRVYANPADPRTRLYVEAERLIDALRGEAAWQLSLADLEDLRVRDGLPDVPLAAPGELMEAWGK